MGGGGGDGPKITAETNQSPWGQGPLPAVPHRYTDSLMQVSIACFLPKGELDKFEPCRRDRTDLRWLWPLSHGQTPLG